MSTLFSSTVHNKAVLSVYVRQFDYSKENATPHSPRIRVPTSHYNKIFIRHKAADRKYTMREKIK